MSTAIPRRHLGALGPLVFKRPAWLTNHVSRLRWIISLAILLPVSIVYANFIRGEYRSFYVVSLSMYPTFDIGDCVIMERESKNFELRGKVIAFVSPENADEILTKRVVAASGDTVALRKGKLLVNGHAETPPHAPIAFVADRNWSVGPNEVFVLGDNRNNSYDSIDYGPVPRSKILGVLVYRYWPFNRLGKVQ